ncbi:HemK2/MTQ2 family protein methyltransferase [Streptomyces silvensis]|uniref:Methyltransferase n=1 Tax=Streptomyces silvensis TaxID=1765722 RepID=A0A0W7X5V5_9ACTN|nr:HemK2/MTQ2 family protein methyltransferase [Streptomyces silvensis]KUF18122.1 methyltransferase [Streptomyces silvensis]
MTHTCTPTGAARLARLVTLPGVYAPQHDTRLLTRCLRREAIDEDTAVVDLGTGSGALAVAAASLGARVTAVDISRRAVLTARFNALRNGLTVTVRHGDLTDTLPDDCCDLVVSNPPYVPGPSARLPRHGAARAWDAGTEGRAVVNRVCDAAPRVLRPGGALLLVHSGLSGVAATLDRLAGNGMEAGVVDRAYVPFGPVLQSRRAWLRDRGLIDDTENREELVVIRAELR